ncbi:MAG: hypothetical protein U5J78_02180 [Parasphingorhabdus sp.]|nr:hypothetical protein [Parasphingorhabdus sp.]
MRFVTSIILSLVIGATAASAMDANSFYLKAQALKDKGMAAMFSSDVKLLMGEMKTVSTQVKAENDAATKVGKPLYCPPAKRKRTSADEIIQRLGAMPEARRKTLSMKAFWLQFAREKYPCGTT